MVLATADAPQCCVLVATLVVLAVNVVKAGPSQVLLGDADKAPAGGVVPAHGVVVGPADGQPPDGLDVVLDRDDADSHGAVCGVACGIFQSLARSQLPCG